MNTFQPALLSFLVAATSVAAFTVPSNPTFSRTGIAVNGLLDDKSESLEARLDRQLDYAPAAATTEFAKRFGSLKGKKIQTVGETFGDFTRILGLPINALYKNMMTDIVGVTHLTTVDARFAVDGIWSVGILTSLDLILKNYPELDMQTKMKSSLFECCGLNEEEVRSGAKEIEEWAVGKTKDDVTAALKGEGDGPLSAIGKKIRDDEYFMYSRFFGIGLVRIMDIVGVSMNADDVYPIMEEWMKGSLDKLHYSACTDSDNYFRVKNKLDMMETMMKEIEIREKKKMAQRLEDRAEAAIQKAERNEKMKEVEATEVATIKSATEETSTD